MISVILPECTLSTYFTVTIKNLILSTSSQTGTPFLEEVKFDVANIKLNRPKDNLSHEEQNALKELSRDKNIVLKKADKGTTTVIMNRTNKLNEGLVQLDDIHNY